MNIKKIAVCILPLYLLVGCNSAGIPHKPSANSKTQTTKPTKQAVKPKPNRRPSSRGSIEVVNSNLPECKGVKLLKAKIVMHGGMIPVYTVDIDNHGARKKVILDVTYRYLYKSPRFGVIADSIRTKELKPITLRANDTDGSYVIGRVNKKDTYQKVEVVECR